MGVDVVLEPPAKRLEESVDLIDLGLELKSEPDPAARLLSLQVDAGPVMPSAPRASGLCPVTLDLPGLAELAS